VKIVPGLADLKRTYPVPENAVAVVLQARRDTGDHLGSALEFEQTGRVLKRAVFSKGLDILLHLALLEKGELARIELLNLDVDVHESILMLKAPLPL
jgi:hypothetical protein